jgi:hypothetical protein
MTKAKDKNKGIVTCPDCKREMTINICETHISSKDKCHYCHLQKEHIIEFDTKEEEKVDKTPTRIDNSDPYKPVDSSIIDKIGKKINKETKKGVDEAVKDDKEKKGSNTYGFSRDDKDDKGLYT